MSSTGREFMKLTKPEHLDEPDQAKGIPQPPLELSVDQEQDYIELPATNNTLGKIPLRIAIKQRTSLRKYSKRSFSLDELSFLLWSTQGVKRVIPRKATFRTVPSAGARHALETYLLVNNVDGLNQGLYRYQATKHRLVVINLGSNIAHQVSEACLGQSFIEDSAVTFFWTADAYRMTWRYGERGYRYLHLDAGHVCQNLYLAAGSIDAGGCAVGAFSDDKINAILALDGENQFLVYAATAGKKPIQDKT